MTPITTNPTHRWIVIEEESYDTNTYTFGTHDDAVEFLDHRVEFCIAYGYLIKFSLAEISQQVEVQ